MSDKRYYAFISYRHLDNGENGRQWASWLHHAIETYEIPNDLIGQTNARGEVIPKQIFPVFRDEEALPADADLSSVITRALDDSRFLIVLCSPRARQSTFVADEIDYFKSIGNSDRIIAAIIDGEPNVSLDQGKIQYGFSIDDECFPEPLQFIYDSKGNKTNQRTEPVAADFRVSLKKIKEQGWTSTEALRQYLIDNEVVPDTRIEDICSQYEKQLHLMLLKIIAGIIGVPLDDLTQRDKAYQLEQEQLRAKKLRRWLVVTAILAIAAIISGVIANQQANEAKNQRGIAEQANLQLTQTNAELINMQALSLPKIESGRGIGSSVAETVKLLSVDPDNITLRRYFNASIARLNPLPDLLKAIKPNTPFSWRGGLYLKKADEQFHFITNAVVKNVRRSDDNYFITLDDYRLVVISEFAKYELSLEGNNLDFDIHQLSKHDFIIDLSTQSSYAGGVASDTKIIQLKTGLIVELGTITGHDPTTCNALIEDTKLLQYEKAAESFNLITLPESDTEREAALEEYGDFIKPFALYEAQMDWLEQCSTKVIDEPSIALDFPAYVDPTSAFVVNKSASEPDESDEETYNESPFQRFMSQIPVSVDFADDDSYDKFLDSVLNSLERKVIAVGDGYTIIANSSAGAQYGMVDLWRFDESGQFVKHVEFYYHGNWGEWVISPDNQFIYVSDLKYMGHPPFHLYDLTILESRQPETIPSEVIGANFNLNSSYFVVTDSIKQLWVYSFTDNKFLLQYKETSVPISLVMFRSEKELIGLSTTGNIHLLDLATKDFIWSNRYFTNLSVADGDEYLNQIHISEDRTWAVAQLGYDILSFDTQSGVRLDSTLNLKQLLKEQCTMRNCEYFLTLKTDGRLEIEVLSDSQHITFIRPEIDNIVLTNTLIENTIGYSTENGIERLSILPGITKP